MKMSADNVSAMDSGTVETSGAVSGLDLKNNNSNLSVSASVSPRAINEVCTANSQNSAESTYSNSVKANEFHLNGSMTSPTTSSVTTPAQMLNNISASGSVEATNKPSDVSETHKHSDESNSTTSNNVSAKSPLPRSPSITNGNNISSISETVASVVANSLSSVGGSLNNNRSASILITSDEFARSLIDAVRKRPCLYNPNHEHYGNRQSSAQFRSAAWQELCKELDYQDDPHSLQTQWKRIRDRYVRERRRRKAAGILDTTPQLDAGSANASSKYFSAMRWIDEFLNENNGASNIPYTGAPAPVGNLSTSGEVYYCQHPNRRGAPPAGSKNDGAGPSTSAAAAAAAGMDEIDGSSLSYRFDQQRDDGRPSTSSAANNNSVKNESLVNGSPSSTSSEISVGSAAAFGSGGGDRTSTVVVGSSSTANQGAHGVYGRNKSNSTGQNHVVGGHASRSSADHSINQQLHHHHHQQPPSSSHLIHHVSASSAASSTTSATVLMNSGGGSDLPYQLISIPASNGVGNIGTPLSVNGQLKQEQIMTMVIDPSAPFYHQHNPGMASSSGGMVYQQSRSYRLVNNCGGEPSGQLTSNGGHQLHHNLVATTSSNGGPEMHYSGGSHHNQSSQQQQPAHHGGMPPRRKRMALSARAAAAQQQHQGQQQHNQQPPHHNQPPPPHHLTEQQQQPQHLLIDSAGNIIQQQPPPSQQHHHQQQLEQERVILNHHPQQQLQHIQQHISSSSPQHHQQQHQQQQRGQRSQLLNNNSADTMVIQQQHPTDAATLHGLSAQNLAHQIHNIAHLQQQQQQHGGMANNGGLIGRPIASTSASSGSSAHHHHHQGGRGSSGGGGIILNEQQHQHLSSPRQQQQLIGGGLPSGYILSTSAVGQAHHHHAAAPPPHQHQQHLQQQQLHHHQQQQLQPHHQQQQHYDPDAALVETIVAHLANLNDDEKVVTKMNIQRILMDARFGRGACVRMFREEEQSENMAAAVALEAAAAQQQQQQGRHLQTAGRR